MTQVRDTRPDRGFCSGPDGQFGWSIPDEELRRFAADESPRIGVMLLGRKLYETMRKQGQQYGAGRNQSRAIRVATRWPAATSD